MNTTCQECGQIFPEMKNLHLHVSKGHKTPIEKYYRKWFPRYDLFDSSPILFKSWQSYLSGMFNNRSNMLAHFKASPSDKRSEHAIALLQTYKQEKAISLAPSTVETRLSFLPSPSACEHYDLDFNEICLKAGLNRRFDYSVEIQEDPAKDVREIICDTREQRPLTFSCPSLVSKLDFGDYTCREPYRKIFIERKSLIDLCGTMSAGYERFGRELERVRRMGCYLVICVERPLNDIEKLRSLPETRHIKASPEFIGHRIKEIARFNSHVQFLFVRRRDELADLIMRLFAIKNPLLEIDLQYQYDYGHLRPRIV